MLQTWKSHLASFQLSQNGAQVVDGGRRRTQEEEGEEKRPTTMLTPPLSLDGGLATEHKPPNIVRRTISLLRTLLPGSDLTHFQLPPVFNIPKSQLQCYGEAVYCINRDMLSRCSKGKDSLQRFTSVVAWSISTTRPVMYGFAPFNPVLGETHHASRGTLNVLVEQVSHHPPISALHAVDIIENIDLVWCQSPVPTFTGNKVEVVMHGKRQVKLLNHNEVYELDSPNMQIKLFPVQGTDWVGNVAVRCKDSGLEAKLCYKSHYFLGLRGSLRSIKGSIFYSNTLKTVYEIDGQWDRTVTLKDVQSGETTVIYDAKEAISKLKTPSLKDPEGLLPTESAMVWGEVSRHLLKGEWDKARGAKREIEEKQRKSQMERKHKGEAWVPKFFTLSQTKEGGWECHPKQPSVPPGPIIYHHDNDIDVP